MSTHRISDDDMRSAARELLNNTSDHTPTLIPIAREGHVKWNVREERMYLAGEPIHAGMAMEIRTRSGWVRGRIESCGGGRILTFHHVRATERDNADGSTTTIYDDGSSALPWPGPVVVAALCPYGETVTGGAILRWPER